MAAAHIFPPESIMGIIPTSCASHTCNSLIRNSNAHTLMGIQHELYVQREECRVGGLDNVGGVRHNVVLDEGSEGSGKESKSHDIMLLYTPAAAKLPIL